MDADMLYKQPVLANREIIGSGYCWSIFVFAGCPASGRGAICRANGLHNILCQWKFSANLARPDHYQVHQQYGKCRLTCQTSIGFFCPCSKPIIIWALYIRPRQESYTFQLTPNIINVVSLRALPFRLPPHPFTLRPCHLCIRSEETRKPAAHSIQKAART